MGDGTGRNERVVGPSCRLTARSAQSGSDAPKRPRTFCAERKDLEICLGLLQVLLTRAPFRIRSGGMRPHGQLGQGYRAYHRLVRQFVRIR